MSTKIEWAETVWNPVTGCTKVSAGCKNCYAERMAKRLAGRFGYPADEPFKVTLHPDRLDEPLRWRKPRRVFVNSMSDLFHEDVPHAFLSDVLQAIEEAGGDHVFQILTKRPERMLRVMRELYADAPNPNIWLGVSVENQETADERIPLLLDTPAAVRFVSAEPLLGPVDLTRIKLLSPRPPNGPGVWLNSLTGHVVGPDDMTDLRLDWVITGGESGPRARPCEVGWIRGIVAQCKAAGVPCFVKQLGARPETYWCAEGRHCTHPDCGNKMPRLSDPKGGDPDEWPEDLRVREWPE